MITDNIEAYTFIRNHLVNQKIKAVTADFGDCRYRGGRFVNVPDHDDMTFVPDGTMCAIGCIISDKYYDSKLEDNNISSDGVEQAVRDSNPDWNWDDNTLELLTAMQYIHDDMEIDQWEMAFDLIDERIEVNGELPAYDSIHYIGREVVRRIRDDKTQKADMDAQYRAEQLVGEMEKLAKEIV